MAQKELSDLVLIPYSSMRGNARRRARSSLIEDLRNPDPESEFGQMILPYLPLLRMPLVGTPLSKAGLLWMEHFMNYDALFLVSPKAGYQDREYGHAVFRVYEKPSRDGLHLPGLHMFHLLVPGEYQGHGFGPRLCEGMFMEARRRNLLRVRLGQGKETEKSKKVSRIYRRLMQKGEELGVKAIENPGLGKNWAEIMPGKIPQTYPTYSANINAYAASLMNKL
ncbi:TPA: hypothetical protein HA295_00290 [Candidatus Woesearchaeota archaeon]|nr:hypothetical protein [Candidatus Woesearchaeota archaeon]